jgi:hypothetical protein
LKLGVHAIDGKARARSGREKTGGPPRCERASAVSTIAGQSKPSPTNETAGHLGPAVSTALLDERSTGDVMKPSVLLADALPAGAVLSLAGKKIEKE